MRLKANQISLNRVTQLPLSGSQHRGRGAPQGQALTAGSVGISRPGGGTHRIRAGLKRRSLPQKANLDKQDKPDKPASKFELPSSVQRRLADCARLDEVMRVFFPLAYFLYMGIMYAVLPLYPHNEGCIGI